MTRFARTLMAAGLGVSLLSMPALAQQVDPAIPEVADETPGSVDVEAFVAETLSAGTLSLRASELAVERAQNARVAEFAGLELREQVSVAQVLSATGEVNQEMGEAHAERFAALEAMAAGPEFDMAYVEAQIELHRELLGIQQTLSARTDPTVEVIVAKLSEQAITSHIAMLDWLREGLAEGAQQTAQ
ncbi:DUF4142 domain-containing protein [Arsenicitalea aurantiaca]|uniref:DUF4142 domain-containing protein n=1 Tax=Arsenicitalea aurantiaca TaxID=1783274 RepID=A0A433X2N4_9HYPH|nr:DUF4142 domain-containing protein [Arsenicitalea aurantiaca]RUT28356.1 DUF4142 domain-containing protein [Arsenicitalea aurantiaca]